MAKRELKTSALKESAAGVSGFCEPEQRNAAAGVSVIHSSSPRWGMDENTGASRCLHRLVPQYQRRGLDLFRHARRLLPGLDNQGPGLSRSQFS